MSEMWFVLELRGYNKAGVIGPFSRRELALDWYVKMYPERDYDDDPDAWIVIAEDPAKVLQLGGSSPGKSP